MVRLFKKFFDVATMEEIMNLPRHKVFISYYHEDDQYYKNEILRLNSIYNIFDDYSVHENEIDDTGLSSETIRQIIRDDYIQDATVLILLCGENTKNRKHVDWEIHSAMFDTENNPKMGILIINLPTSNNLCRASTNEEKFLISPSANWISLSDRNEYERNYPNMPSRIIDNFIKNVPISVVNWNRISSNVDILKKLIHNAYDRRKTNDYDHSAPLRRQNS